MSDFELDILNNSTTRLSVRGIRTDGGTQPRAGLISQIIIEYAEAITGPNDWPFPPVVVYFDGSDYWLADGFHRLAAAKMYADREKLAYSVVADIRQGTQRDAILYSVGANSDHGLRRTTEDKHRAVTRLLADEEWGKWSDREIARQCKVSPSFVGKIRSSHTFTVHVDSDRTYTTKHGTVATMNTAKIGATKPATASVDDLTRHIGSWLSQQNNGTPGERLTNAASRDSVTRRHLELFLGRRDVAFKRDDLETAIAEVMANVVNTGTQERQTAPSTDNGYTIVRNPRTGVAIPQLIGKPLAQAFDNEDYQIDEREAAADAAAAQYEAEQTKLAQMRDLSRPMHADTFAEWTAQGWKILRPGGRWQAIHHSQQLATEIVSAEEILLNLMRLRKWSEDNYYIDNTVAPTPTAADADNEDTIDEDITDEELEDDELEEINTDVLRILINLEGAIKSLAFSQDTARRLRNLNLSEAINSAWTSANEAHRIAKGITQ